MNGTLSIANFSFVGIGGGPGGGAFAVCDELGAGLGLALGAALADGGGAALAVSVADATCFVAGVSSSLVKYRNPATPIATIETTPTTSGHIQFGPAASFGWGFLICGFG